jgi:hypothetical protein
VDNELGKIWKEVVLAELFVYPGVYLYRVSKPAGVLLEI